ncbi:modification methylase [Helicobacter sp. MIT 11-5569]|nr:modification methylase [Helicobacter sp. MIT 11-5569]
MKYLKKQEYHATYNSKYDFLGQSYGSLYPNLHKYPATMLPQIGLELFKEFKVKKSNLLDPFCGSGSSFISGLEYGITDFVGFDLNPLAIMIAKARLQYIETSQLLKQKDIILEQLLLKNEQFLNNNPLKNITNLDFWLPKEAQQDLKCIFSYIEHLDNMAIQNLFLLAFSETLRETSYTRNNEFKLFRMKNYENYKPNVYEIFNKYIEIITKNYLQFYQPKLKDIIFSLINTRFKKSKRTFDTILTSTPYGDSRTTVAYGQFSTFINEWLGFKDARKLDSELLGGKKVQSLYNKGLIKEYILEIYRLDTKRALEVSSFYFDLELSIKNLIDSINMGGKVFFVVGNRKVKNIELPTDKFISEIFCNSGFRYLQTIKRKISNKSMPPLNSPSNKSGFKSNTMNEEYIIVCERLR